MQTKLDAATLAASTREVELRKTHGQLEHEREQGVREAREAAQELARVRAESAQQVKSTQETVQSQADEQVRQLRVEVRELKFGLEKSAKESARLKQQRNTRDTARHSVAKYAFASASASASTPPPDPFQKQEEEKGEENGETEK